MNSETDKAQKISQTEQYYDSDAGFKFYNIINGADYTGIGLYEQDILEKEPLAGDEIWKATQKRDNKFLEDMLANVPEGKKLRILELGAGRGGLSRLFAEKLIAKNLLDVYVSTNISEAENIYNREAALKQGITTEQFVVVKLGFEEEWAGKIPDGVYDVILSNECFLHCQNRNKLYENTVKAWLMVLFSNSLISCKTLNQTQQSS